MADDVPAWRAALRGTEAPLQWSLLVGAAVGGTAGAAAAWPLDSGIGIAFAGIVAGLATAVAFAAPAAAAAPAGVLAVLATTATTILAGLTTGRPVLAALSMALVALLTSAALAAGKVGAITGALASIAYLIAAILGVYVSVDAVPPLRLVESVLVGTAVGAVLAVAVGTARRRRAGLDRVRAPDDAPRPWAQVWTSLRTVDEFTRDGIRRALALGAGMLLFQLQPDRNAMWIFVGAYVVLMPTGRDPLVTALVRVVGTLVGVVAIGLLALVLPGGVLGGLSIGCLLGALLYSQRNPTLSAALSAAAVTLMVGAPSGSIPTWGGLRLLDTAVGCALAIAAGYLLWPRGSFGRPGGTRATGPGP